MPLNNAELVINGFGQLPQGVQQVQQYQKTATDNAASNPNAPTTDFQKSLYEKYMKYLEQTGDVEGAKRGFAVEMHQYGSGMNGGGGLSTAASGPSDSGTGPNGATPISTTTPVQEPPASMAVPPPVKPAQLPERRPLFHREAEPQPSAPTPKPQPVDENAGADALDKAAQPLAVRNPQLAAAPPPQAPQPPMQMPQNQRDFDSFTKVAPQFGAMANARTAASSRENVASINAEARMALEDYRQGGREFLQQKKAELAQLIQGMRADSAEALQAQRLTVAIDIKEAELNQKWAMFQQGLISKEELAGAANDIKLLLGILGYDANLARAQAMMGGPNGMLASPPVQQNFRQVQGQRDALAPQVQGGLQSVGQRYGVTPQQPQGQPAPQPQQPNATTTTTQTQSTPVQAPQVTIPGSTASKNPPAPAPAPAPAVAPEVQATADSGAKAAQEAKLPASPKPEKKPITKPKAKTFKPTDKVKITMNTGKYKGQSKTMTYADVVRLGLDKADATIAAAGE